MSHPVTPFVDVDVDVVVLLLALLFVLVLGLLLLVLIVLGGVVVVLLLRTLLAELVTACDCKQFSPGETARPPPELQQASTFVAELVRL